MEENKTKKMVKKVSHGHKVRKVSKFLVIELVLLFLIVGGLFLFTPKINGVENQDKITFFKFTNAYAILIDDNSEFTSPEKIEGDAVKLKPGQYYWKAVGVLGESVTGNFSIDSEVKVSMKLQDDKAILGNEGNVPINASSRDGSILSGNMIIDLGEKKQIPLKTNNMTLEVVQGDF